MTPSENGFGVRTSTPAGAGAGAHPASIQRLFRRFTQGELPLNRLEAFSDGVFAIIVTLLVLELKVPELHEARSAVELGHRLLELLPKFLS